MTTPAQDYDDSYTLEYCMTFFQDEPSSSSSSSHSYKRYDSFNDDSKPTCYLISNDRYRDHVEQELALDEQEGLKRKNWIRKHVITYTFVQSHTFLPNPDYVFTSAGVIHKKKHKAGKGFPSTASSYHANNYMNQQNVLSQQLSTALNQTKRPSFKQNT